MSSIFRIVSSNEWEEAKINGLIPKSEKEMSEGVFYVYQFDDLERLCHLNYSEEDYPIALELEPSYLVSDLTWHQPNKERNWKKGVLKTSQLYADLVMNIYSFEWGDTNGKTWCKIVGE